MKLVRFFIILTALFAIGCGKPRKSDAQSESLVRGYKLIDENRLDEAISFLSEKVETLDPQSTEFKDLSVCLASAYAKKSGITIRDAFKIYEVSSKFSSLKLTNQKKPKDKLNSQEEYLLSVSKLLLTNLKASEILASIRNVPDEKRPYLIQAVKIMGATANLSPADLIYSAFIKIILVRSYLGSQGMKYTVPQVVVENGQCVAKLSEFRDYLLRVSKILVSGLDDLGSALPKQKKSLEKASKDIVELVTNISSVNFAAIAIYNLNADYIGEIYRSLGLGSQKLSCEPDVEESP